MCLYKKRNQKNHSYRQIFFAGHVECFLGLFWLGDTSVELLGHSFALLQRVHEILIIQDVTYL